MGDVIAVTTLATFKCSLVTLFSMIPLSDVMLLWLTPCSFAREVKV